MHPVIHALSPLQMADDWRLEEAVNLLTLEAQMGEPGQAERAEALAILSHEFRRRENLEEG